MWSPIKYLFGDSEETETVASNKPAVDRSFWGDEVTAQNTIKHVAFVKYITGWLEKHKSMLSFRMFCFSYTVVQDSVDILLKEGKETTIRQLADRIKSDSMRTIDSFHSILAHFEILSASMTRRIA
jgi:hypothetical protein